MKQFLTVKGKMINRTRQNDRSMNVHWTVSLSPRSSLPGKESLKLVLKEEVRQGAKRVFLFSMVVY